MSKKLMVVFMALILGAVFFHNIVSLGRNSFFDNLKKSDDWFDHFPEVVVVNINDGPESSAPSSSGSGSDTFAGGPDSLYYTGTTENLGHQICYYTEYVTETPSFVPITNFGSGSPSSSYKPDTYFYNLTYWNQNLYYSLYSSSGNIYSQPWHTQGNGDWSAPLVDQNGDPLTGNGYGFTPFGDDLILGYAPSDMGNAGLWHVTEDYSSAKPLAYDSVDGPISPSQFTLADGTLYFSAYNGSWSSQLWKTDGTPEGTEVAVRPNGEKSANPNYLTNVDGTLYFTAQSTDFGNELIYTPGRDSDPYTVYNLAPGSISSYPSNLCTDGSGKLYCTATSVPGQGKKAFVADRNSIAEFPPVPGQGNGTEPFYNLNAANGHAFFQTYNPQQNQMQFYSWTGNPSHSYVNILNVGQTNANVTINYYMASTPQGIVISGQDQVPPPPGGNRLLADDAPTTEIWTTLWFSDGTLEGTRVLRRFARVDGKKAVTAPTNFKWLHGFLLFTADDGVHGAEPWISDLTPEGTRLLDDVNKLEKGSYPYNLTVAANNLFFLADDGTWAGNELHVLDKETGKAKMLGDIQPLGVQSAYTTMTGNDEWLFFRANDGVHGSELWQSKGTITETFIAADIYPGKEGSSPTSMGWFKGNLYFSANNPTYGRELWKTNGNSAPQLVSNINTGAKNSNPSGFAATENSFFFQAFKAGLGTELWKSDGTDTGTKLVAEIYSGNMSSFPEGLCVNKGRLFFTAQNSQAGRELWMHDESITTTILVRDILPGTNGSNPWDLYSFGDWIFFTAETPETGRELWKSDGTFAGTTLVADIEPGPAGSSPSSFFAHGNILFFTAYNTEFGRELWKTDGTDKGTTVVKDIWEGASSGDPAGLAVFGDLVYFAATHPVSGRELWETDGTAENTRLTIDIIPGLGGSIPTYLKVFEDYLYFAGSDAKLGREIMRFRMVEVTPTPTPTPTPTNTPTPTPTPTPVVVADFTATPTLALVKQDIFFFDLSTGGIEEWEWDFGDLNLSSEQNPVHAYDAPGTYTVSLFVSGPYGADKATKKDYIIIKSLPTQQEFVDYLLGKAGLEGGDLNGDGKVDIADLIWLILMK